MLVDGHRLVPEAGLRELAQFLGAEVALLEDALHVLGRDLALRRGLLQVRLDALYLRGFIELERVTE